MQDLTEENVRKRFIETFSIILFLVDYFDHSDASVTYLSYPITFMNNGKVIKFFEFLVK